MSFFTMDESKVTSGGGSVMEEGDYEVIITSAQYKLSSTQKDMVTVDYEVRSDVEQKYQGWKLRFNNFTFDFEEKDGQRVLANKFTNALLFACGWGIGKKPGAPLNVKDMEDMAQQLVGKTLQVVVKHEEYVDKEDGKTKKRGVARFTNRSKVDGDVAASNGNSSANNNGPIEVNEDDLPF